MFFFNYMPNTFFQLFLCFTEDASCRVRKVLKINMFTSVCMALTNFISLVRCRDINIDIHIRERYGTQQIKFLDAPSHLYKRAFPPVGWLVGRSVGNPFFFSLKFDTGVQQLNRF